MALSDGVVCHVRRLLVAFTCLEIRFCGVATSAGSVAAVRVSCDGVRGERGHCYNAAACGTKERLVVGGRVHNRDFWRGLPRFHCHQDRFFSRHHDCHVLVRRGACSSTIRSRSFAGVPGYGARCAARRGGGWPVRTPPYAAGVAANLGPDQDRVL